MIKDAAYSKCGNCAMIAAALKTIRLADGNTTVITSTIVGAYVNLVPPSKQM